MSQGTALTNVVSAVFFCKKSFELFVGGMIVDVLSVGGKELLFFFAII